MRAKSKKYSLLECGVATTWVIPSATADSAMAIDSAMVAGPSSIPGRMWQCTSTIRDFLSLMPPRSESLPSSEREQNTCEDLPHPHRPDPFHKIPAQDAANK